MTDERTGLLARYRLKNQSTCKNRLHNNMTNTGRETYGVDEENDRHPTTSTIDELPISIVAASFKLS